MIERCVCVFPAINHTASLLLLTPYKKYAIICIHVTHAEEKKKLCNMQCYSITGLFSPYLSQTTTSNVVYQL